VSVSFPAGRPALGDESRANRPGYSGIMGGLITRRPTRGEVLGGVLYLVIVVALTWLALADAYTYAYWVRFVILLPSSLLVILPDYFLAVLLFGPEPTTLMADIYFTAVAIGAGAMQLSIAWIVRNRGR
jgi:hypothetical protein